MKLVEKKLSIAKEIGLRAPESSLSAPKPAAKPLVSPAMRKTEKSLATIGNEMVNIGMYVGGRRFLKIWAVLSLLFAVAGSIMYPSAWTLNNVGYYALTGDKLYFWIINGFISIPTLFLTAFVPMVLMVVAAHYIFINWRLPNAARAKMSRLMKWSVGVSVGLGALIGITFCLFSLGVIPNTLLAGVSFMKIFVITTYITVGMFVLAVAGLSLYKEFTFMLGRKD
ncbi:MAG: hypothetical protein LBH81_00085 [Rickettsiales bacterium]|jgi:hypothetical protein|nr:hypothetical protein [Rickettsiales bacterium]